MWNELGWISAFVQAVNFFDKVNNWKRAFGPISPSKSAIKRVTTAADRWISSRRRNFYSSSLRRSFGGTKALFLFLSLLCNPYFDCKFDVFFFFFWTRELAIHGATVAFGKSYFSFYLKQRKIHELGWAIRFHLIKSLLGVMSNVSLVIKWR